MSFLVPFPTLLVVLGDRVERQPISRIRITVLLQALFGGTMFAAGIGLTRLANRISALNESFALDHAVKLLIFVLAIESLSRAIQAVEHLAGYPTSLVIQNVFLSRTVAEFWNRYNRRVHAWLDHNVFRPSGGRRAPWRAILVTFFVSAVLHEAIFAVATSRLDGYQFTFFMLQAPAVGLSRNIDRFARRSGWAGKTLVHGSMLAWFYFTSMFFFHGVNRVFPFVYGSEPWLP